MGGAHEVRHQQPKHRVAPGAALRTRTLQSCRDCSRRCSLPLTLSTSASKRSHFSRASRSAGSSAALSPRSASSPDVSNTICCAWLSLRSDSDAIVTCRLLSSVSFSWLPVSNALQRATQNQTAEPRDMDPEATHGPCRLQRTD